jgi:hypothetical protein
MAYECSGQPHRTFLLYLHGVYALTSLQLYEEGDKRPIAWFVQTRSTATGGRAYLALEEEAEAIRDDLITYVSRSSRSCD